VQAKDISDEEFLEVVRKYNDGEMPDEVISWPNHPEWKEQIISGPRWASVWDLEKYFDAPRKVILAKASKLLRKGLMDGCACGCSGSFEV
jgi:hypothetical protein